MTRTVASRSEPLGPEASASAGFFRSLPDSETYETRFLAYGDGEHVVTDRGFENEARAAVGAYGGFEGAKATWDPSNPNVCTLDSGGSLLELKVTKRSFEAPGPGGFGSSEYARIALAGRGVSAVPVILARRLQTKYRWDPDLPDRIEALEIHSIYDPAATGFSDLNRASPVLVLKSRLAFAR